MAEILASSGYPPDSHSRTMCRSRVDPCCVLRKPGKAPLRRGSAVRRARRRWGDFAGRPPVWGHRGVTWRSARRSAPLLAGTRAGLGVCDTSHRDRDRDRDRDGTQLDLTLADQSPRAVILPQVSPPSLGLGAAKPCAGPRRRAATPPRHAATPRRHATQPRQR